MNNQQEFLPKWYESAQKDNTVAKNTVAVVLIVLLAIFTLGIFTSIEHLGNTIKGRD
jgi:DMSO reductase anchor subunit